MLVPDDDICYMGSFFPSSFCGGLPPQPECSFSGYSCIDANNVLTSTECTSRYSLLILLTLELCCARMEFSLRPSLLSVAIRLRPDS